MSKLRKKIKKKSLKLLPEDPSNNLELETKNPKVPQKLEKKSYS